MGDKAIKLKLSNADAQRMLGALRRIDENDTVKLSGPTRLDIARNINILMPHVTKFEREAGALQRGIVPGEANLAANKEIVGNIDEMNQSKRGYKLHEMAADALRLDDNPRITGDMIASLAPILKDFDSMEQDGDTED